MPAESEVQAKAARLALAVKRGEMHFGKLKVNGAAFRMYKSMSEKELEDLTHVGRKKAKRKKKTTKAAAKTRKRAKS